MQETGAKCFDAGCSCRPIVLDETAGFQYMSFLNQGISIPRHIVWRKDSNIMSERINRSRKKSYRAYCNV